MNQTILSNQKDTVSIFESGGSDYDSWFYNHPALFENEILALKKALPVKGIEIEIGVGSAGLHKH